MEKSLVLIKPNAVQRGFIGEIIARFERKGLFIAGIKMMQLDDAILNEHYAHLSERSYFGELKDSMMVTPVVAICVAGLDTVETVRQMVGATNARKALPGTIRGDFSMSGEQNVIHASDTVENAIAEVNRFFKENEIFNNIYLIPKPLDRLGK
jgi:nucleoside-diphosphate kinase